MTTLEIPFSVPPYMSLLARSVATLEGIALAGDPDYQMVAQVGAGVGGSGAEEGRGAARLEGIMMDGCSPAMHCTEVGFAPQRCHDGAHGSCTTKVVSLAQHAAHVPAMQAYPFVVRKILRNDSSGAGSLLRDILYDPDGNVKPTRMSALLNAALGYVSDKKDGFVDFDAVPDEGASVQVGRGEGGEGRGAG